ncbi:hypothetical protein AAMO2058_000301900 [Amorphochlora amoebiformis]
MRIRSRRPQKPSRSVQRRFLSTRRSLLRCTTLRILLFVFGVATVGILVFLGYLLVRFPPNSESTSSTLNVRVSGGGRRLPKLPDSRPTGGVELADSNATRESRKGAESGQDFPDQKIFVYSELDCKGDAREIPAYHIEGKCAKCFDACAKKYSTGLEIQGNVKSMKVVGQDAVVSTWATCKGTWNYPEESGYINSILPEDGCVNQNVKWQPVHFKFHMKDDVSVLKQANERKKEKEYVENPIKDPKEVLKRISYFGEGGVAKQSTDKYITFLKDCGGFNNIRMGFEYAVLMAWVTGRTLVLPPPEGWYLIDFGPIKRGGAYKRGVTKFSEFFDMEHLRAGMPVITAKEFYEKEKGRLDLKEGFEGDVLSTESKTWKAYLFQKFGGQAWSPLKRVVMDPSIATYKASNNQKPAMTVGRTPVEFDEELKSKAVIHFPSCHGPNGDQGIYRFLGQISNSVLFADKHRETAFKSFWKNHIHYPKEVFTAAAHMIAKMGLFAYSALHVRRNDLQYKEVYIHNIHRFPFNIYTGEVLYIATDETNSAFFDAIREKHKVFQWKDVVNEAKGIQYSEKVINIIEQTICAGGRRFFGTQKSTFTSYIFRMRGYMSVPDTKQYWHNIRYTGMPDVDKFAQPILGPNTYMQEDPSMWEDIVED